MLIFPASPASQEGQYPEPIKAPVLFSVFEDDYSMVKHKDVPWPFKVEFQVYLLQTIFYFLGQVVVLAAYSERAVCSGSGTDNFLSAARTIEIWSGCLFVSVNRRLDKVEIVNSSNTPPRP